MLNTPILFLIFNRPDTTIQVFESIKKQKPKFLYIAADGPRPGKEGEAEICQQVRDLVINGIDWDCEVKTLFREENLGCGIAVSTAITWFFENVEEGIILEDDCLPNQSFFMFCQTLLEYYRDDERIYVISGNNFQKNKKGYASYYFSAYCHIWGWATWRRVWCKYNFSIQKIDNEDFKNRLNNYFQTKQEKDYWIRIFNTMKSNPIDTWDYQLAFMQWMNGGINILPNYNLITNIGFNEDATHTKQFIDSISMLKAFEINEPIIHPNSIYINRSADLFTYKTVFCNKIPFVLRVKNKVKQEILRIFSKV